jgi:tetratricopeptide (TPR) repeat protein
MALENFHPEYVSRGEEERIRAEAALVRETGQSRALLIYGAGGIGKTSLVRGLARAHHNEPNMAWLEPIDVDDPQYWLLSTLERSMVRQLDRSGEYFGPYLRYLSQLSVYTKPMISQDRIISHLGRVKRVFVQCYTNYINETNATVVMTFDTIEAMRGNHLLYTLTQWMKSLPGTLFILAGRPMVLPGDRPDPILDELADPYQNMPVTELKLGPFAYETGLEYLRRSAIGGALEPPEEEKLVLLTRGHPLWLAFAVSHISEWGMPVETAEPLEEIRQAMPYAAELDREGQRRHEAFKRRMMVPYREVDFWHEAINRLAVVRQGMSQPIWERLMSDRPLPAEAETVDDAWRMLQETPWIRSRANGMYVTVHDAVAEELAQRIIPLHDSDQAWRKALWARAAVLYSEMTEATMATLEDEQTRVNELLGQIEGEVASGAETDDTEYEELVDEVVRLDVRNRELDQLRVVGFHYQLLSDFAVGTSQFLRLFNQARQDYDPFLQDRLALEMQRFLPGADNPYPLADIITPVLAEFADWLTGEARESYLLIGMTVGGYLIDNAHPNTAITLLNRLPDGIADNRQRAQLEILKANAYMRMPLRMEDALGCLDRALEAADGVPEAIGRQSAIADVYKERGFCYRNAGRWLEAEDSYERARNAVLENFGVRKSDADREDMASIQTNWAYLKGLRGDYRAGTTLVQRAIDTRHDLGLHLQEGISCSVKGEILRYERMFEKSWESLATAEQIFHGRRDWSWLGQVYQEQAICLLQAMEDGTLIEPDKEPTQQAQRLIRLALDICRDQNPRAYPSALNRAGRIFGANDVAQGLEYLAQAAIEARRLSDGWFWFASLIEYVDLAYGAWAATRRPDLRAAIDGVDGKATEIRHAMREYPYDDLRGRWLILAANLALWDWESYGDDTLLDSALRDYTEGFRLMAQGQFGSSGASLLDSQFGEFRRLFFTLPTDEQERWRDAFSRSWRNIGAGSTVLLACLEQIY